MQPSHRREEPGSEVTKDPRIGCVVLVRVSGAKLARLGDIAELLSRGSGAAAGAPCSQRSRGLSRACPRCRRCRVVVAPVRGRGRAQPGCA
jgi:hypothetical protein